ncbi:MAG TPA: hypothetical protein GX497_11775 [Bacillus bacterium]|nr:hypothetical protein [Bacillus sp. (in: firmicutes)]
MSEEIEHNLDKMHDYIKKQKWLLIEGIIDYRGSSDGLFTLPEKLNEIDVILIYDKNNIIDEFNLEFLYKIAKSENVEVKEYFLSCKEI